MSGLTWNLGDSSSSSPVSITLNRSRNSNNHNNSNNNNNSNRQRSTPQISIVRQSNGNVSQRVVVTAARGAGARVVKPKNAGNGNNASSSSGSGRSLVIESTGSGNRRVAKRKSGEVITLKRTVTNEDAMADGEAAPENLEAPLKRGRGTVQAISSEGFAASSHSGTGPLKFQLPTPSIMQTSLPAASDSNRGKGGKSASSGSEAAAAAAAVPASAPAPSAALPAAQPVVGASYTTVLLRNLAPGVNARFLLQNIFGLYNIHALTVDVDPQTLRCNGTAECVFVHEREAKEAIELGQGMQIMGQPVRMSIIAQKEGDAYPPTASLLAPAAAVAPSSSALSSLYAPVAFSPAVPTPAVSSSAPFNPSPFSVPTANVGFVWNIEEGGVPDQGGEETIFNITNLKMPMPDDADMDAEVGAEQKTRLNVVKKAAITTSSGHKIRLAQHK